MANKKGLEFPKVNLFTIMIMVACLYVGSNLVFIFTFTEIHPMFVANFVFGGNVLSYCIFGLLFAWAYKSSWSTSAFMVLVAFGGILLNSYWGYNLVDMVGSISIGSWDNAAKVVDQSKAVLSVNALIGLFGIVVLKNLPQNNELVTSQNDTLCPEKVEGSV